jgi:multiple sugar transport system substrate-binding protein
MVQSRKTSRTVLATVTLGAFIAAAGFGPTVANAAGSSGVTTIVWASGSITQPDLRPVLISMFEKAHPNIKVKLVNESSNTDTTRAQLTTQIGGGSATPDVYLGDVIWPAQFANAQLALPLNKYLPKSFFNRFAGGLVDGATYKGNIYAAPFFVDSAFLFYRKDLLQKAHLPVPTTWEQVQSESQILQKKKLVKYGFVWQGKSYEGLTCDFMEYLTDAGGKVLNPDGSAAINSPAAVKALKTMKKFIDTGVTPKAVTSFQENDSLNAFESGQAAFIRNWSYTWTNANDPKQSKIAGKVGVVPLPSFTPGKAGYGTIGGWDLYVNPHSKNIKAALTFIDWMTGTEAQTVLATKYNEIPTNAAVQNSAVVKKKSPILNIAGKVHFVSRPDASPNYAAISQAIYTNVNQALSGGISIEDALKKAADEINAANNGGL